MRALLGALALLLVLPMGARGDGDWNDDDLPYTMATRVVSGDVLSDANLPLRLLDPTTGAVLLETNTDPLTGNVGFGPGVQRGLQTNVLNGDFSMPPPDPSRPIDNTSNPLPYWTYVDGSDSTATWVATTATGSGGSFVITPDNAPTTAVDSPYLQQDVDIPASAGQQFRALGSVYIAFVGSSALPFFAYQYLGADGAVIGSESQTTFNTLTGPAELKVDMGLPPPTAAKVRVKVGVSANFSSTYPFYEVRVALIPAETTVGLYSRSQSTGAISTTETMVARALIPANSLLAGSQYVIKAFGTLSVSGGVARTATFRLRVGPTTLTGAIIESMNPTTTTTASGDGYMIEATLTIASTGATGDTYGSIEMNGGSQPFAVGTRVDVAGSAVTIDTTVANYIELTAETSNAAATTTFRQAYIQCVMAS